MAQLIGSLFVSLTADFAPFQRNMKSAEGVVASTTGSMRRNVGLTEKSVASFHRTTSSQVRPYALIAAARTFDTVQQRANLLRGALFATTAAFGGLGAALTTNVVSRYLDAFTGLENQMRVVSSSSADLAANMSEVQVVAERSRSSLTAVGTLFSRIAKASPEQGTAAILRRVETVNKALQLGGATAQEAASAAIQFSQAIASNRLGGEELRAVLETPLGNELAKGLGVTIGEFRKMGTEGKLTAAVLFKALDKISGGIDQKFAKSISTIDQALTVADGKITMYAGHLDDAYGITKLMTAAIGNFGDNLETIVPLLAIVGAGLGSVFGGRLVGGSVGRSYAAIAGGIREVTEARIANLRIEKEAFALAQRTAAAAKSGVTRASSILAGDASGLADRKSVKQYERDLASLAKTSGQYTKILQAQADAEYRLNSVAGTSASAINQRAAAQAKLNTLKAAEASIVTKLAAQRAVVDSSRSAVNASGIAAATANLTEAQRAALGAEAALVRTTASMAAAQGAATRLSVGLGVLRASGASLVGFLGGPWGVAFTTAIAALAYFGSQARATAEEIARAQAIIDEVTSGAGGEGVVTVNERIALSQKKIIAETERLALVTKEAARQRNELADAAALAATGTQVDDETFRTITALIERFREGKVSLDEFVRTLAAAGVDVDVFKDLGVDLAKSENAADLATLAIKRLSEAISVLKKQLVGGGIAPDVRPDDLVARDMPRYQRALYGRGQEAARQAAEEARRRREVLDAAGDTGDSARNTPAKIAAREQELLEQGYVRTREAARALATEELNLAEAQRIANKELKAGTKEAESFASKLRELQEQGEGAFLSDLDRKVLDVAKALKDGSAMMAQYIAAIKSGDMSQAPPELLQARDALMQIGAADTWRGIIEKYGQGVQLAGQFADKQLELNYLVATGKITAQQSEQAWADFIGQFKEHEWIDQTADALATFANSAITDFENIGDAFKNLVKQLAQIALQAAVLDPFKAWIRGSLSSMVGGGATGSGATGVSGLASGVARQVAASVTGAANDNSLVSLGVREARRAAIASIESAGSGDYAAIGVRNAKLGRPLGRYQMMEANLPAWSKAAMGRSVGVDEFMANPGIQDTIFDHRFGGYVRKYGDRGAAQAWFGGEGSVGKLGRKDVLGTSVGDYGDKYVAALQKMGTTTNSATEAVNNLATGATAAKDGIGTFANSIVGKDGLGGLFGLGLSNTGAGFNPTATGLMDMLKGAGSSSSGGGGFLSLLLGFLPKLFGGFAKGTDSATRGWKMVGERGPEWMKMRGGEKVVPAHRSRRLPKGITLPPGMVIGDRGGRDTGMMDAISSGRLSSGKSTTFLEVANRNVSNISRRNAANDAPKVDIHISLDGATGNQEVHRIARSAVAEGLGAFQAQQVQGGVQQNQKKFASLKG